MAGTTNTRTTTTAVTAAGAAIHENLGFGQPERTGRSTSTNEATAIARVSPSCTAISCQPEMPTRSAVTNSRTGQCHRYTPYEMSPNQTMGFCWSAQAAGPFPSDAISAAMTSAVN